MAIRVIRILILMGSEGGREWEERRIRERGGREGEREWEERRIRERGGREKGGRGYQAEILGAEEGKWEKGKHSVRRCRPPDCVFSVLEQGSLGSTVCVYYSTVGA